MSDWDGLIDHKMSDNGIKYLISWAIISNILIVSDLELAISSYNIHLQKWELLFTKIVAFVSFNGIISKDTSIWSMVWLDIFDELLMAILKISKSIQIKTYH